MIPDPPTSELDPVDGLADEYLARRRRGERPTPSEYAARYPEHAARIHELFPALELIERLKPAPGDYTILREIGRGDVGVVHEAEHG
jgi:hypothetical protein